MLTAKRCSETLLEVPKAALAIIDEHAKQCGYPQAISDFLGIEIKETSTLKQRAHYYFVTLPTGFFDGHLLVRSWFKAAEEALSQNGIQMEFRFPHIDPYVTTLSRT